MNEFNKRPAKRSNQQKKAASTGRTKPANQPAQGNGGKKKSKSSVGILILKILATMVCIGVIIGSVLAVMLSLYVVKATADDDQLLNLDNIKMSYSTILYATNPETGEYDEYARLIGEEHRVWVDLGDMPAYLPQAFIAIEDKTFADHSGVNWKRTISATANLVLSKLTGGAITLYDTEQGASTIDQQLIKNITKDNDHDAMRKVREIFRALALEKKYTKDQIMEAYLNTVNFVGNTGGVAACASNLFGKEVKDLTLLESACIAAITNNPTKYNPRVNPENNRKRVDLILWNMMDQGYITEAEYEATLAQEIVIRDNTVSADSEVQSQNSWFTDYVIDQVISDLVEQKGMTRNDASTYLYNGGLRIYTTVDTTLQSAMEEVMGREPGNYYPAWEHTYVDKTDGVEKTEGVQGCMVTVGYDGSLLGIVGGLGQKTVDRGVNRASDNYRQTGSTMKPIGAYALGIDYDRINYSTGLMDSMFKQIPDDERPGEMRDWPRNYNGTYTDAEMTVATALAKSINTVAVRAGNLVGEDVLYDFMVNTLGITTLESPNDVDLGPLVLGSMTNGVTALEMANSYTMFGNGGTVTPIHAYTTVEDVQTGEVVLDNTALVQIRAISSSTAMIMNKLLSGVMRGEGTAAGIGVPNSNGMPAVGKTGTTSNDNDHWFIGLTPYYCTATWMGYDHTDELAWKGNQYSKHPPTLAWKEVMEISQTNKEAITFPTSDDVVTLTYCTESGGIATGACPGTATGYYKKTGGEGSQPEVCHLHAG